MRNDCSLWLREAKNRNTWPNNKSFQRKRPSYTDLLDKLLGRLTHFSPQMIVNISDVIEQMVIHENYNLIFDPNKQLQLCSTQKHVVLQKRALRLIYFS